MNLIMILNVMLWKGQREVGEGGNPLLCYCCQHVQTFRPKQWCHYCKETQCSWFEVSYIVFFHWSNCLTPSTFTTQSFAYCSISIFGSYCRTPISVMMTLLVSWSVQSSGLKLLRSRIQVWRLGWWLQTAWVNQEPVRSTPTCRHGWANSLKDSLPAYTDRQISTGNSIGD